MQASWSRASSGLSVRERLLGEREGGRRRARAGETKNNDPLSSAHSPSAAQIATRAITFLLNLATARRLSVAAYGVAAVQFHLVNTAVLVLAREGVRRGCLTAGQHYQPRAVEGGEGRGAAAAAPSSSSPPALPTRQVLATAGLALPAGAAVAAAVLWVAGRWGGGGGGADDEAAAAAAAAALRLQAGAALLELAAEPLYVLASLRLRFGVRVGAEAAATLARGGLSLWLLGQVRAGGGGGPRARWGRPPPPPPPRAHFLAALTPGLALSWGQVAYGAVILGAHLAAFAPDAVAALTEGRRGGAAVQPATTRRARAPRPPPPSRLLLDPTTLALCRGFSVQAAEKLALGEGSRAVLAASAPAAAQGAYGLAANVGSLAVRTLFAPVEEAAFLAFARPGPPGPAGRLLATLARFTALVGGLGAAFGPPFAWAAVRAVYGRGWACGTAAPAALGAYAAYTALLALNGVLEAFAHARGGPSELAAGNAALLGLAALGAGAGVAGARSAGAVGLVAADALTMALRIAWALGVVRRVLGPRHAPRFRPGSLLPAAQSLAALAVAGAVCCASDALLLGGRCSPAAASGFWPRAAAHAGVGVCALVGAGSVLVRHEGAALREVRASLRSGKDGMEK